MIAGVTQRKDPSCIVWSGWPYLIVLLIAFFAGAFGGAIFAFSFDPSAELADFLRQYCETVSEGRPRVSFFASAWDCIRWPLWVSVLGITVLGTVGIPILFAVRGFLLSFTTATFGILLGSRGIAITAVLFSVSVLFVLPALFILGCNGLRASCLRLPSALPVTGKQYRLEIWLICIGVLTVSAAIQWTVVPAVLTAACSRILF